MEKSREHRVWSCRLDTEPEEDERRYLEWELRERNPNYVEEARLLASGADLRCDVLKVPNHADDDACGPGLIAACAPSQSENSWGSRISSPVSRFTARPIDAQPSLPSACSPCQVSAMEAVFPSTVILLSDRRMAVAFSVSAARAERLRQDAARASDSIAESSFFIS